MITLSAKEVTKKLLGISDSKYDKLLHEGFLHEQDDIVVINVEPFTIDLSTLIGD